MNFNQILSVSLKIKKTFISSAMESSDLKYPILILLL